MCTATNVDAPAEGFAQIFMYRCSPFAYMVSGMLSTGLAGSRVTCSAAEYVTVDPSSGTCAEYMSAYIQVSPATLCADISSPNCHDRAPEVTSRIRMPQLAAASALSNTPTRSWA